MYIRLWDHMHMGMGRRMHVSMYISNLTSHFRMATEIWSMYRMMGPMNGKGTVSEPFFNTLLTLQPLKLALELLFELNAACYLILQSGQALPLGPDLICKQSESVGGGTGPKGGCAGVTGTVVMRLMLLSILCLNSDPACRSISMVIWTSCRSASMVASLVLRGRMDGSAPVAAVADAMVALSWLT